MRRAESPLLDPITMCCMHGLTFLSHLSYGRESVLPPMCHCPLLLSDWSTPYARTTYISGSLPHSHNARDTYPPPHTPLTAQSSSSTSLPARAWRQKRANLGQASAVKSVHFYCLCTATEICLSHWPGIGAEEYSGFSVAVYHFYTCAYEHHFLSRG